MFRNDWKQEIFTIPNLLSLFRLVLIPVYMNVYLHAQEPQEYYFAGAILAVSCLTDALDGMIARYFNSVTTLGKILDPLADKITQLTLIVCLSMRHTSLQPVCCLLVMKELFQLAAGMISLRNGRMLTGALVEGKICTAILFISLILLVMFPELSPAAVRGIAAADTFVLCVSFAGYLSVYLGHCSRFRDMKS